jgi:hypothetical protein
MGTLRDDLMGLATPSQWGCYKVNLSLRKPGVCISTW